MGARRRLPIVGITNKVAPKRAPEREKRFRVKENGCSQKPTVRKGPLRDVGVGQVPGGG